MHEWVNLVSVVRVIPKKVSYFILDGHPDPSTEKETFPGKEAYVNIFSDLAIYIKTECLRTISP